MKHRLPYEPAIALIGGYPKEMKIYIPMKTCPGIFIHNCQNWNNLNVFQEVNRFKKKTIVHPYNGLKRKKLLI